MSFRVPAPAFCQKGQGLTLLGILVVSLISFLSPAHAEGGAGTFVYYCQELPPDREWSLRFTGTVPEKSEVVVMIVMRI